MLFIIASCSSNSKNVYWCGDHPCINKTEKEAYFKKTMIVEIKELKKEKKQDSPEIEKIIKQAKLDEKRRIKEEKDLTKHAKLEEKRRIKEEKDLTKHAKLEEKRRIKEEKDLTKQAKLEEKRRIKEEKDLEKSVKKDEKLILKKTENKQNQNAKLSTKVGIIEIDSNKFDDLTNKILKRNSFRSYPDLNDIPN